MIEELWSFSKHLGKAVQDLVDVSNVLQSDIENLGVAYRDDWSSQPYRRMFVRSCWAMIEGEVFGIKKVTLSACELGGKSLSAEERTFLSESKIQVDENGSAVVKPLHDDTLSNLKRTLKIACSKFELDWSPDFATQGWDKLRHSLERRHSITHPKTPTELAISDIDLDVCKDGFAWFLETCNEFHSALLRKYVD